MACASASTVLAESNEVGVTVCGSTAPPAQIDITQPLSDSVVDQAITTFRGTVANASQVETYVDGQYNGTVSIGSSDTSFQIDITLQEGTHTIEMTANAICGGQDANDSVVVTYQPVVAPSSGGTTPTVIGEKVSEGETASAQETIQQNDIAQTIEQIPIIGGIVGVVSDFATAIGLESTVVNGNANTVTGIARVGVTVAALTSVVMASSLAPVAAQAVPGVSEIFNVSSHRSMIYLGWVIRGVGVLAMALAYFL